MYFACLHSTFSCPVFIGPPDWRNFGGSPTAFNMAISTSFKKKHSRFFSARIHDPADSFVSNNEGMNEAPCPYDAHSERHHSGILAVNVRGHVPRRLYDRQRIADGPDD